MENYYQKEKIEGDRVNDVYVPKWAQTLIDLYTSGLKDEVMDGIGDDGLVEKME